MSTQGDCGCGSYGSTPYPYGYPYGYNPNPPSVDTDCQATQGSNPCATPKTARRRYPNSYCDDRFECLPPKRKIRILGADGRCLVEFNEASGFVVSTGQTQEITNQPAVNVPYLRDVLRDDNGQIVTNDRGEPMLGTPPPFQAVYVTGPRGELYRLQGQPGQLQKLSWNSNRWEMSTDSELVPNPVLSECDVPLMSELDGCPVEVGLLSCPITEVVRGKCVTTQGYKLARRATPTVPYGMILPFGGPLGNVPPGWIACDGRALSATEYPYLFQALGYAWGGTGTTFFVPDLRGRFLRGVDGSAGRDLAAASREACNDGGNTGNKVGSVQTDTVGIHEHDYTKFDFTEPTIDVTKTAFSVGSGAGGTVTRVSDVTLDPGGPTTEPDENGDYALDIALTEPVKSDSCSEEIELVCETRVKNAAVEFVIHAGCSAS